MEIIKAIVLVFIVIPAFASVAKEGIKQTLENRRRRRKALPFLYR